MDLKLDSIIIFVENIDQLKLFYVDILKLEIVQEFKSEWLLLKAGNCNIGLHKFGNQHLETSKKHLEFHSNTKIVFETNDDIHQLRERLLSQGVVLREVKTFDDYWLCDGEDPEGNIFQIKQKLQSASR